MALKLVRDSWGEVEENNLDLLPHKDYSFFSHKGLLSWL